MTIISTAAPATNNTSALVAEFAGGAASDISMMIGIGLVKDSDAVFFQYQGEGIEPLALVQTTNRHPAARARRGLSRGARARGTRIRAQGRRH